eukprot:gb/GEZN01006454.1/.p1 GENE.gb/GEZN01006454.1/~~gb/GEZN01006454.1/.p1  ORF type:complete len:434 (+),score=29.45 gb/GEZN01006454.1/:40-1302(+)
MQKNGPVNGALPNNGENKLEPDLEKGDKTTAESSALRGTKTYHTFDPKAFHHRVASTLAVCLVCPLVVFFLVALFSGRLAGNTASVPPPIADQDGFWGEVTANVDWCEPNYYWTSYVAEFFNSTTSVFLVLWAIYGLCVHGLCVHNSKPLPCIQQCLGQSKGRVRLYVLEPRFACSFLLLAVIGLGSFLYHCTLLREYQLLDELPMIWINSVFLYVLMCMRDAHPYPPRRCWLSLGLFLGTVVLTAVVVYDTEKHDSFLVFFAVGVVTIIFLTSRFRNLHPDAPRLFNISILTYAIGFVAWLLDQAFCHTLQTYYLHALWHVCVGAATYSIIVVWLLLRQVSLGYPHVTVSGTFPFQTVSEGSAASAYHNVSDKLIDNSNGFAVKTTKTGESGLNSLSSLPSSLTETSLQERGRYRSGGI